MATLWSNTDIPQKTHKKLFWGEYRYRLEAVSNSFQLLMGTASLADKPTKVQDQIERRIRITNLTYRGQLRGLGGWSPNNADVGLLADFIADIKKFKFTVEYRRIRVFANTEAEINEAISLFYKHANAFEPVTLCSVSVPDPMYANLIRSGVEFSTVKEFSHKVVLRDRRLGTQVKQQILGYLDGLGDVVKVTPAVRRNLEGPSVWSVSVWFRTKDPSIISFLELMSPGIVSKCVEVIATE